MSNWKLALIIWLMASVTIAGAGLTVIVATPSLANQAMTLIPIVTLAGFVVAYFVSLVIAKQIKM